MQNTQPPYIIPDTINVLDVQKQTLSNNIPLSYIEGGDQDVCKIDFVFDAGSLWASKPLQASFTSALMVEGADGYTSKQISEIVDYHGAYIIQNCTLLYSQITLFCLSKHVEKLIPVVESIIKKPSFDTHEFELLRAKREQSFLINQEKVKTIAQRKSREVMFGVDHPFGRMAQHSDYGELSLNDIKEFYTSNYSNNTCRIIVSGKVDSMLIDMIESHFGNSNWGDATRRELNIPSPQTEDDAEFIIPRKDSKQCALRIETLGISRNHPDFMNLRILITILGGYFGSRLMSNLREEKGLTYGISSWILPIANISILGITAEVISERSSEAVEEIFAEMHKLQTTKVEQSELEKVKNYIVGELQRGLDGPFSVADAYKNLLFSDIDMEYYPKFVEAIKAVKADDLQQMAIKYFNKDKFKVIMVG